MAFPDIKAPKSIRRTVVDNTLRSPTEAGYVHARPRTTRSIYDFDVTLLLSSVDLGLLLNHDATVTGASIFSWYNTDDNVTYQVRYTKRPTHSRTADQKGYYDVSFSVQSI